MMEKRYEMKKLQNAEKLRFYSTYTILFAICMLCTSLYFINNKATFIWSVDGISQHYNALAYYGEYLRDIFWNLFENHRLAIPTYDFSIGYGADVLNTLHYYVIGDPLNLLAVFVQKEHTEILFHVLIIARIYLAGIAFCIFARSKGNRSSAVLVGVPIYLFSEYVLYFFCKHPFFLNPLIYFPLILLGVDKIYRKKGPGLYIISLIISVCSNFYFFYMLGILTVIYAVFQYFYFYHSIQWKTLCRLLLKFGVYTFWLCVWRECFCCLLWGFCFKQEECLMKLWFLSYMGLSIMHAFFQASLVWIVRDIKHFSDIQLLLFRQ